MTIRDRIFYGFVSACLLFLFTGYLAIHAINKISKSSDEIRIANLELIKSDEIRREVMEYLVVNDLVITGDLKRLDYLNQIIFALKLLLKVEPGYSKRLNIFKKHTSEKIAEINSKSIKLLSLNEDLYSMEGNRITEQVDESARDLIDLIDTQSNRCHERLDRLFTQHNKIISRTHIYLILIFFILISGGITSRYLFLKYLRDNLLNVALATEKIAEGSYDTRLVVTVEDEIGNLQNTINRVASKLEEKHNALVEYGKNLEEKVSERSKEVEFLNQKLLQKNKMAMLGQISSAIAHEIRNPITIAIGTAQVLQDDFSNDSQPYKDIETIISEMVRCNQTIEDILELSREVFLNQKLISISKLLDDSVERIAKELDLSAINVSTNCLVKKPLYIDNLKVEIVLCNLIKNGVQAMDGKGELLVTANTEEITLKNFSKVEFVRIDVADNGKGITSEDETSLFTPFFTTKKEGTGLGLTLCQQIILAHGGWIEASNRETGGAIFSIHLPLKEELDG